MVKQESEGAPEQDVHGLLEGALRERPRLGAIDAVARDGHEVPARRHAVAQRCQVTVVDVPARLHTQTLSYAVPLTKGDSSKPGSMEA